MNVRIASLFLGGCALVAGGCNAGDDAPDLPIIVPDSGSLPPPAPAGPAKAMSGGPRPIEIAASPAAPLPRLGVPPPPSPLPVVRLPPLLVTDNLIWRYASFPGYEIISSSGEEATRTLAEQIAQEQFLLDAMVPPTMQARSVVPTTIILSSLGDQMDKKLTAASGKKSRGLGDELKAIGIPSLLAATEPLPQMNLEDADSITIALTSKPRERDGSGAVGTFRFEPEYVFSVLTRHSPPPPLWFSEGLLNYRYNNREDGFFINRQFGEYFDQATGNLEHGPNDVVTVAPMIWLSPGVTEYLQKLTPNAARFTYSLEDSLGLFPVGRLFAAPPGSPGTFDQKLAWYADTLGLMERATFEMPFSGRQARQFRGAEIKYILAHGADDGSPWQFDVWKAELTLFVRWAFDDATYARREALWKLASLASTAPLTEAMFKECFGLSFAAARTALADYLPNAIAFPGIFIPPTPARYPLIVLHDSTAAERARIFGDWQGKEFDFVAAAHSEDAGIYEKHAARGLTAAYARGVRDPGFLAVLGLYECRVNEPTRAREVLEAAIRGGVVRPRAYVELARLRYRAAMARPAAADGRLDRGQVASVLELLRAIGPQPPPQLAGYLLAADVWEHAGVAPARADVAMLEEGLSFFPHDSRLIVAADSLRRRLRQSEFAGKSSPLSLRTNEN